MALVNSTGNAWTSDSLKITGELDVDLRSNIAAESRAKIVYERQPIPETGAAQSGLQATLAGGPVGNGIRKRK